MAAREQDDRRQGRDNTSADPARRNGASQAGDRGPIGSPEPSSPSGAGYGGYEGGHDRHAAPGDDPRRGGERTPEDRGSASVTGGGSSYGTQGGGEGNQGSASPDAHAGAGADAGASGAAGAGQELQGSGYPAFGEHGASEDTEPTSGRPPVVDTRRPGGKS